MYKKIVYRKYLTWRVRYDLEGFWSVVGYKKSAVITKENAKIRYEGFNMPSMGPEVLLDTKEVRL